MTIEWVRDEDGAIYCAKCGEDREACQCPERGWACGQCGGTGKQVVTTASGAAEVICDECNGEGTFTTRQDRDLAKHHAPENMPLRRIAAECHTCFRTTEQILDQTQVHGEPDKEFGDDQDGVWLRCVECDCVRRPEVKDFEELWLADEPKEETT